MDKPKAILRDLDWISFKRKELIGLFIVQFDTGNAFDRLTDVAQITEIYINDFCFTMKADGNCWMLYNWEHSLLPEVREEGDNIVIEEKILGIRYIILRKTKER